MRKTRGEVELTARNLEWSPFWLCGWKIGPFRWHLPFFRLFENTAYGLNDIVIFVVDDICEGSFPRAVPPLLTSRTIETGC